MRKPASVALTALNAAKCVKTIDTIPIRRYRSATPFQTSCYLYADGLLGAGCDVSDIPTALFCLYIRYAHAWKTGSVVMISRNGMGNLGSNFSRFTVAIITLHWDTLVENAFAFYYCYPFLASLLFLVCTF